jgi:rod shape-determining protein MreC
VHQNYLTINSGSLQGVKHDMAVINSLGIIGRIDEVSPHYATVISILNTESIINAKLKKSNHFGSLTWKGKSTGFVQLIDIPRLAALRKGDTVVTGGQSIIFPENIDIGTIEKIYVDNQTNYYTLDIRLFNDMTNLGPVYILKNKNTTEILELENRHKNE